MGALDILKSPKILYITRLVQLCFATGFLVLICFAGTHRGWWNSINGPLALGGPSFLPLSPVLDYSRHIVVAVLFTLAVAGYSSFAHFRGNDPFKARGTMYTIARLVLEVILFLLWIGSAVLALRPHGGCDIKHRGPSATGEDRCWKDPSKEDTQSWKYTNQPLITWDIAIAFSFVEM